MNKLIKQLELLDNIPTEAVNLAKLIDFKLKVDKVITKQKIELILDNLSELEGVLEYNNIQNDVIDREIKKIKLEIYNKQKFFKDQEVLKVS